MEWIRKNTDLRVGTSESGLYVPEDIISSVAITVSSWSMTFYGTATDPLPTADDSDSSTSTVAIAVGVIIGVVVVGVIIGVVVKCVAAGAAVGPAGETGFNS
ncbi:hypothetical protein AM593_10623, partial [Mytilus galloprovincialis]